MKTYTAFCRDIDGPSMTWIDNIHAVDEDTAVNDAVRLCAAAWECDSSLVECFALALGELRFIFWNDRD